MTTTLIDIADITIDAELQVRAEMSQAHIDSLAEDYANGEELPPVVCFDDDGIIRLAGGFHRVTACEQAGLTAILADIREGTKEDAIEYAASSNDTHGLRRSNADKRRAVIMLLSNPKWAKESDREIGRICKVDHKTVGKIRSEVWGIPHLPPARTTKRLAAETPEPTTNDDTPPPAQPDRPDAPEDDDSYDRPESEGSSDDDWAYESDENDAPESPPQSKFTIFRLGLEALIEELGVIEPHQWHIVGDMLTDAGEAAYTKAKGGQ